MNDISASQLKVAVIEVITYEEGNYEELKYKIEGFLKEHPDAVVKDIKPYGYSYMTKEMTGTADTTAVAEKALILYEEA